MAKQHIVLATDSQIKIRLAETTYILVQNVLIHTIPKKIQLKSVNQRPNFSVMFSHRFTDLVQNVLIHTIPKKIQLKISESAAQKASMFCYLSCLFYKEDKRF